MGRTSSRSRESARRRARPARRPARPAVGPLRAELAVSAWFDGRRRSARAGWIGRLRTAGGEPRLRGKPGTRLPELARLLGSLAHPRRIQILLRLLAGRANRKCLTELTGLKAGPLYYHLRELRVAGLIGPKVRDDYVLTLTGQRAILSVLATAQLCRAT